MSSQVATGADRPSKASALPRGAAALPPEVVLAAQRQRLVEAVGYVIGEKGYGATTITDIVARARVSRSAFYDCFKDKEDAFLAAYAAEAERHFGQVALGVAEPDWLGQLEAAVRAYVRELEEHPAFARTFLIEILAAGPAALARREEIYEAYATLMKGWYEQAPSERRLPALPDDVYRGAVGAINELAVARLQDPGSSGRRPLEQVVLYSLLALFGLHEEARRVLETT